MACGCSQALLPLVLSISLIICLSGVAQGRKVQHPECEKVHVIRPNRTADDICDGIVLGDSGALVAIHNGAVTVALKLDRNGKRKMRTMDDSNEELEEQMEDANDDDNVQEQGKRRRKRRDSDDEGMPDEAGGGKHEGKGMERRPADGDGMAGRQRRKTPRVERFDGDRKRGGKMQGPKCIRIPTGEFNRVRNGEKLSKPMTFKVLGVKLLNEESEELEFDIANLKPIRKRKVSASSCTLEQTTIQDETGEAIPIDVATIEYRANRRNFSMSVILDVYFFKKMETFNGDEILPRTLKSNIKISINKCDYEICDQINSIKLFFLINIGAVPLGKYGCDEDRRRCNIRYGGGGSVEFSRTYMYDNELLEVGPDALSTDDNNIFTIRFPGNMTKGRPLNIEYDPIMSATAEEFTGDEDTILFGVYSSAERWSLYYPLFYLILLVNLLARLP